MAFVHGELKGEFQGRRGQLFLADDAEHSAHIGQVLRGERDQDLFGVKSGARESIIKSGAAATAEAQQSMNDDAKAKAKARADDILLLALINSSDLEAYIAKQVFGDMSAEQIAEVVARIEEQTGMTFEEYAKSVLGDDYEPRRPGETDAEYQLRILEAVTAQVLDGNEIRPEYADDPVAQILKERNLAALSRDFAAQTDAQVTAEGAVTENHIQNVENEADDGYGSARALGRNLVTDALVGTSRGSQDDSTDIATSQNTNSFGALFNAASMGTTTEPETAPSPEPLARAAGLPAPGVG